MSYYDEESLSLCGVEDFCRSLPLIVNLCSSVNDAFYVGWRKSVALLSVA